MILREFFRVFFDFRIPRFSTRMKILWLFTLVALTLSLPLDPTLKNSYANEGSFPTYDTEELDIFKFASRNTTQIILIPLARNNEEVNPGENPSDRITVMKDLQDQFVQMAENGTEDISGKK